MQRIHQRKIAGLGQSHDVYVGERVDCDRICRITAGSAQVGAREYGRTGRAQPGDKSIVVTRITRLQGAQAREIVRSGVARDVGIAHEINCDCGGVIKTAAAEIRAVSQRVSGRTELYNEGVGDAAQICRLERARRYGEVG